MRSMGSMWCSARQQAAVNRRMQRLHPPIQDLGEADDLGNAGHGQSSFTQDALGVAGRQQAPAQAGKAAGEFDQSGFVVGGQECTHAAIIASTSVSSVPCRM
jgi:hypothetical protein